MKQITLYGKHGKGKTALVDDEDFEMVNRYRWYVATDGSARLNVKIEGKQATLPMHRFILKPPREKEVDHKNGNRLDNRRCNIRVCTSSQNIAWNIPKKKSKSGYRGVYQSKVKNWEAMITVKQRAIYLGTFKNKIDAALAYDDAARKYFKDFARPNFPDMLRN